MIVSVGCRLGYQVLSAPAHFTFNIFAGHDPQQRSLEESLVCVPEGTHERVTTSKGNRVLRVEVPPGLFEVRYEARLDVARPALPAEVKLENPGRLPLSILTYTLPSRYCECDRFAPHAWELFGRIENRAEQVREICRWVDKYLEYAPGATDSRTSAWEVWQLRKGVCRDYTHLAIALCRALMIPARYVGCYAVGLDPMDFHACFEVYLGGQWYLCDPSDDIAPDRIVVIARGRDAANAPLTTIFGRVSPGPVVVTARVVDAAAGAPAGEPTPG